MWKDYLTPSEVEELAKIDREKREGQAYSRRIYDRCRKRMERKRATTLSTGPTS
jgi:hypothetical protein